MKFTDGYWRKRDGLTVLHPAHYLDSTTGPDSLTVYAAVRPVRQRGDTLNAPLITVTLTAPAPDVIRVTIDHFQGGVAKYPNFSLTEEPVDVAVDAVSLTSGALTAQFRDGEEWGLDFLAGGKRITGSGWKGMGVVDTLDGGHYVHEQLDLGVGETVYGLGERFGPLVKNGQSIDVWNEDGGTSSEQAYKNVPFYFTTGGYGVLVDHPGKVSFEVASEMVSRTQFSVAGQSLSYLVIHGPTPADVIRRYTALTGRPALPPAWSFGLWLSTSFTTSYDEDTVNKFIDGMAERDLPLSVFHFDTFWMREFSWCDFEWDTRTFPDPPGMLKRLAGRGLKVCLWINPYIAQRSPLFAEAREKGFLVRRANGDVFQWDLWQAGMGLVDFTNPGAREWYADKLRYLAQMGVDAFKSDFGERVPTDVVWHDGSDPERMHNYYTQIYNQVVFDVLREVKGEGEAVLFARSATVGGQQFPVHWGGDNSSTYESMAESLRGGLSLMSSGFGFWSHDIGGFEGMPDPAVFKRWVAFGLLSSHSRLHGSTSYRVPWNFDEESSDVLRTFTHLKYRLMPYLFAAAREAHETGLPVMRPMVLGFPDDPATAYLDRQYLLGPDLLVAPVFSTSGEVRYYVPAGRWTNFRTGEVVEGPRWVTETHGFDSVPLLGRPGAVIPIGARTDRPDYDYRDGVTLRLFEPIAEGTGSATVPGPSGETTTFTIERSGTTVTVSRTGDPLPWNVQWGTEVLEVPAGQDSCALTVE
ncbi:putative glycosyl hydrolase [Actinoplanes missouriensis 431]|uniref:alpha-D-xyloside xylohydrolase n=1 Tax=Actinoplanes missouriensis (strain ATCC 14538 / DSM 43046 / CBS 188.64 / JCM 3121 / NBRC 102363 / NCIMB 12654 / NRRL B-3342 / UNCC 431) TaxID=512565 RepID=I0H7G3_ACTM4|nr:alpha-xylosidase [Actinoplanes missouriensis]BAL88950.1 putative glycosyl hydrolase [Actinoplanes missouriensis 431]